MKICIYIYKLLLIYIKNIFNLSQNQEKKRIHLNLAIIHPSFAQPFLERSIQITRSRVHIVKPDHAFCARICRAYVRCPGACTGAHTLIGYGATVMRRLIRKWSGQLCEGVNNDPGSHRRFTV